MNEVDPSRPEAPGGSSFKHWNYKACFFVFLFFDDVKSNDSLGLLNLEVLTSSIRPQVHAILSTLQLRKGEIPVNSPWGVGLGVEDSRREEDGDGKSKAN